MKYITLLCYIILFSFTKSTVFENFLNEHKVIDKEYLYEKIKKQNQKLCFSDTNSSFENIIAFVDEKIYYSCSINDKYQIYSISNDRIENIILILKKEKEEIKDLKIANNFLVIEKKIKADYIGGSEKYEVEKINLIDKRKEIIENKEVKFFKNNILDEIFYLTYGNLEFYKINFSSKNKIFEELSNEDKYGLVYMDEDILIGSSNQKIYDINNKYLRTEHKKIYQYDMLGKKTLIYETKFDISSVYVTDDKKYIFIDNTVNKEVFLKKRNIITNLYIMELNSRKIEKINDENFILNYKKQGDKLFLMKK